MNKALLYLSFFVFTSLNSHAQLKDNLSFGPLVGFGHSTDNYSYNSEISKKFNPSFNGGLRLVYSASPHFGFGLDGTFRTEGVKQQYSTTKQTIRGNYINLDPKLYYFFGKYGQAFRPKIGVGPNFGFLVGGKTKSTGAVTTTEINTKGIYNGFNFGLAGTIGFNYRIKSGTWLNVDAVYNNGFSDLSKISTTDPKSRSIFLNVGVTFGIGHVQSKK